MTSFVSRTTVIAGTALVAVAIGSTGALAQSLPAQWQVGGMAVVAPKYEGSKEYRVFGFPLLIPDGYDASDRVSVANIDDIRFRLLNASGFEVGPVVGYRFGRDEDDGNRLTGMGDIDGGIVVGAYAGYRFANMLASVSYGHQVTGDDDGGGLLRFGLEAKFRPTDRVKLTATVGTTWANDDYMATYFGVTALQATASRAAFDAEAGFKDVNFTLASDIALDQRWTLKLVGRYTHLLGDAADSPIVETESQFYGGLGLTYRFDVGSLRR